MKFTSEKPRKNGYYWAVFEHMPIIRGDKISYLDDPFHVAIDDGEVYVPYVACPIATERPTARLLFGDAVEVPEVEL